MEVALGLVAPATGARADVVVRAPVGARLRDVVGGLAERVSAGAARVSVDGHPVAADAPLGEPPLVEGALLALGPAACPSPPAALELRCTGGPDAGGRWPLHPGALVLGRDGDADVSLDDDELSRAHCRLVVGHPPDGVRVADLGSTNGTRVDGTPVDGEVPLPLGVVLRAGASSFVVAAAEQRAPLVPVGDGTLRWNRPPRLRAPHAVARVGLPARPTEPEPAAFPWLAVLAPLVLGVVLWRVVGSATFLLFTLLTPVMAVGSALGERRATRRRVRRELVRWQQERSAGEAALAVAVDADERRRRTALPDAATAAAVAEGPLPRLWERRRDDDDVLHLRLGTADQPAGVEVAGGSVPLARDVPAAVALTDVGVLGVAGPRQDARALARWLLLQCAVWHSPRDLRLVVLAGPAAAPAWRWARWLPHVRAGGGHDCRALLGLGVRQAGARVAELNAVVAAREADDGDRSLVVVVVDGAQSLRAVPGLAQLLADGPAVGLHAVVLEDDPRLLPEQCGATAVVDGPRLELRVVGRPALSVAPELVGEARAERVARALAPLRDASTHAGTGLPASVRWADVVGLARHGPDVGQVLERWASAEPGTTALLGIGPDGVFAVDLVRDGPHALVAGTTGSGKSELLQTLIASLALGNRPDELALVLVDYKGGAAFGPCADLPHVAGLVTDLDGGLAERALTGLSAELTRREAVLATSGSADVDEHRRRTGGSALPRLVIVVDEYASLAADLPEVVDALVGIAMRGRSLGVHLVLATQRPEGVVSADVRANTDLRLCLAVARDGDSRDVLDSPAAARISRATPGRGFARAGAGELTPFQTARVAGPRPSPQGYPEAAQVAVVPADELGDPLPRPPREQDDDSDLALLVAACRAAAQRLGVRSAPPLWQPPLATVVPLDTLPLPLDRLAVRGGRVPPLAYGLLDVPARQTTRPLLLDLDRSSHLLVVGQPRSGRTTVLRTLAGALARTASPDDVHLYAVDLGGALGGLAGLPHTGAVVGRDQPERLERLLSWLTAEVARRTRLLGDAGHADVGEQRSAAPPEQRLPHLLLLLDRWEAFVAEHGDVDGGRLVDAVLALLREGPSAGLHVAVTADRSGLVGRLGSLVEERLVLRLADPGDYGAAGIASRSVPSQLPPGRGLHVPGEPELAQVAVLGADPSGPAQAQALSRLAQAVRPPTGRRPRRVESLPARVRLPSCPPEGPGVVLGVGGDELEPVRVDLSSGLLVAGPPGSGRSTALLALAHGLAAAGYRVVAVAPRPSPLRSLAGCAADLAGLESRLVTADGRLQPCALLVDDAELLADGPLAGLLERAVRSGRDAGVHVAAAGTTDDLLAAFRGFAVDLRRARQGLLLRPRAPGDGDLLGVRLPRTACGDGPPGRGVLVRRGALLALQVGLTPTQE